MSEKQWNELKKFLDDHDISYELDYVWIRAGMIVYEIHLPFIFYKPEPIDYNISPEAMKLLQEAVDEMVISRGG